MSSHVLLNRRKNGERRLYDIHSEPEHRRMDSRRHGSNNYFLVLGNGGIDGFSIACLIALALIALTVTVNLR